ncbi:(2Fe-2S)-binding protein [Rhizobium sp. YIM 134829]|uniref:(2Fe-2S)-binding protein n=1 Tax=Rhizobium sp. YIM 134829 TaxID=3390453 RepID=UPI00397BB12B
MPCCCPPFFLTKNVLFSLTAPNPPSIPGSTAMLVCSCNFISEKEIEDTITSLLDEDCWQLIVPAKVYHAMQKRGRCCGCFPNVVDIIIRTTERYHAANHSTEDEIVAYISRIKKFHEESRRAELERRHQSHRAA